MLENILLTVVIREAVDVVKKIISKWFGRRKEKRKKLPQDEIEIAPSPGKPALAPPLLPPSQQPGVQEPSDVKEAQAMITNILKQKRALCFAACWRRSTGRMSNQSTCR